MDGPRVCYCCNKELNPPFQALLICIDTDETLNGYKDFYICKECFVGSFTVGLTLAMDEAILKGNNKE